MSTLPDPPVPRPDEPPAVALLREKLGGSRVVRWARRHRTAAAALGALVVTLKAYKWLLPWLFKVALNPGEGISDVRDHWELLVIGSGLVFAFGFVTVRFGLDWLDRGAVAPCADLSRTVPGPAWAERPPDVRSPVHIPPRMG